MTCWVFVSSTRLWAQGTEGLGTWRRALVVTEWSLLHAVASPGNRNGSLGVLCAQCALPRFCLGASTALLATESGQQCGLGQLSLPMPQTVRLTQEYGGPKPGHSEFLPQGNWEKVYFPDWGVQLTVALLLARYKKTYLQERMTHRTSKNERKQKWCYGS